MSGVAVKAENLYGEEDPARDVNLRASGDTPLTMWIASFGEPAKTCEWPGEEGQESEPFTGSPLAAPDPRGGAVLVACRADDLPALRETMRDLAR